MTGPAFSQAQASTLLCIATSAKIPYVDASSICLTVTSLLTSIPMQKSGRVRQEARLDPGPLQPNWRHGLVYSPKCRCLEAVPIWGRLPSIMLKVPGSSQAGIQDLGDSRNTCH